MFRSQFLALILLGAAVAAPVTAQPASATSAASANRNVPRADYIATMDGEYRKMDADKNGRVTKAEIESFERGAALGQARARAAARFAELDADRNGQLSQAEFARIVTGAPAVDGRPLLTFLDTNKDGNVSLVEHRAGKLSRFDQIDTDKDGTVTLAEMKVAGVVK